MIVTVFNAKGGVAKTTTALNLTCALAEAGYTVACINTDPQKNLLRFSHALKEKRVLDASGLFPDMAAVSQRLREYVEQLKGDFDFVVIDCPPTPMECNEAALAVSDLAIAPVQPGILGADGLGQLQRLVAKVRRDSNPNLTWRVLITMIDSRNPNHPLVANSVRSSLKDTVLPQMVKLSPHFDGAAIEGKSIFAYSPTSHGAKAYKQLAQQVIEINTAHHTTLHNANQSS